MDYDLLMQKASQINVTDGIGHLSNNGLGSSDSSRLYAMPSLKFLCSGNITGFLFAADVRIDSGRSKYASVRLFNVLDNNTYSDVDGTTRPINVHADYFSTSGVFKYVLPNPITYNAGQILGAQQPNSDESIVRLYYEDFDGQDIHRIRFIGRQKHSQIPNSRILLRPLTS